MSTTKPDSLFRWQTFLALCALGILLAPALGAQTSAFVAHDAWVRLPDKSKTETALYVVVENHTAQPRSIVSASSDIAAQVEMHQMTMVKMMMTMAPVPKVPLPANGKASFDPNGYHIMLFGLKTRPALGDKVKATLKLDDGTTVPVEATVRK
jgi:periplasmic copper chaperone A